MMRLKIAGVGDSSAFDPTRPIVLDPPRSETQVGEKPRSARGLPTRLSSALPGRQPRPNPLNDAAGRGGGSANRLLECSLANGIDRVVELDAREDDDVDGDYADGHDAGGKCRPGCRFADGDRRGHLERVVGGVLARLSVAEVFHQAHERVGQVTYVRGERSPLGRIERWHDAREEKTAGSEQIEMVGILVLLHDQLPLRPIVAVPEWPVVYRGHGTGRLRTCD
jgi:hypothetical protein